MPDYNYQYHKNYLVYNGDGLNGHGQKNQWNDTMQCLSSDCFTLMSKLDCASDPGCICYDSCPLGRMYFPLYDDFVT